MTGMISWLNANQGFTTTMLTAVYVLATVVIVFVMHRANRLAAQSTNIALEIEKRRTRPVVVFDVEVKQHRVRALVRNIGQTSARNVVVTLSPPLGEEVDGKVRESPLLKNAIRFLPPAREIDDFIDASPAFYARYSKPQFRGSVTYEDESGARFKEDLEIDLAFQADLMYIAPKDVGREIEQLNQTLEAIARKLPDRTSRSDARG